jgi:hypothetical protein
LARKAVRGNFRPFCSATGLFRAPPAFFVGFLANYKEFLRRLGEVDSARGNSLAPKQTKKTNESKNKIN